MAVFICTFPLLYSLFCFRINSVRTGIVSLYFHLSNAWYRAYHRIRARCIHRYEHLLSAYCVPGPVLEADPWGLIPVQEPLRSGTSEHWGQNIQVKGAWLRKSLWNYHTALFSDAQPFQTSGLYYYSDLLPAWFCSSEATIWPCHIQPV